MQDCASHGQVRRSRHLQHARTLIGWGEVFEIEWGDTLAGRFRRDDLSAMCGFILWQANLMDDGTSHDKARIFHRIRQATAMAWIAMMDGAAQGEEDYRVAVRGWVRQAVSLLAELEMLDWVPAPGHSVQQRRTCETVPSPECDVSTPAPSCTEAAEVIPVRRSVG
jgi:hypothetical protein